MWTLSLIMNAFVLALLVQSKPGELSLVVTVILSVVLLTIQFTAYTCVGTSLTSGATHVAVSPE